MNAGKSDRRSVDVSIYRCLGKEEKPASCHGEIRAKAFGFGRAKSAGDCLSSGMFIRAILTLETEQNAGQN